MDKEKRRVERERKQDNKIKRILVLENKIFEIIHVISIICIFILALIIAIEIYLSNKMKSDNSDNLLENIEIVEDTDTTTSNTYDSEEVLLNPGKGFVLRDSLDATCDDMISVVYYRMGWSTIEPEEGQYNWSVIDSKINNCKKRGKKFAFGIMNSCVASTREYVTPKWVFDAGAEYTTYENSYGIIQKNPVWTDEIFLEKLNNFIKALAERYDGNENIAYIDIRSYGSYGEQHLTSIGGTVISAEQLKELYIEPYMNAFESTLLINPWGKDMYNDTYKWAVDNGISIRRDGILPLTNGKSIFEYAYGKLPTIFEYFASYSKLKENGYWNTDSLLNYVETWHPSYIEFFPDMYNENKEFCEMLANKIGYYFKFKGATYTNTTSTKQETDISLNFTNEGVAPLYEPCTVYIGLLDENYNLVKKYKTDINPQTWMPEESVQENINMKLDGVETGRYIISLGLFLNEEDENPTYLLGNSGKTNDKWYVFGEIYITNPAEEYSINAENEKYLINSYKDFYININLKNLRENSSYIAKVYINNKLKGTVEIDNSQEIFDKKITLRFGEGNNTYKIQIEKDNNIVYEYSKEIYGINFSDDYSVISNTVTSKYSEFREKFANEILQVPNLSSQILQMENYITNVGKTQNKVLESASIQAMKKHYELGNLILQAYKEGTLQAEDVKVSSMLDMLDDIGDSYEDLVTVSAKNTEINLEQTNSSIQEVENLINSNQEVEITYPTQILELSKNYYETASYINSIEEENSIKAGLIISNNLHSELLVNWANTFANIQIERYISEYIANNPVTISYSETNITNQNVKATLTTTAEIQVTNNSNSKVHTFEENDSFTFEYTIKGQAFKITATVENIDKLPPTISEVTEGKLYLDKVTPIINDENLKEIKLILNGETVSNYKSGTTLTEEGFYEITATDQAGNTSKVSFQILVNKDDNYKIQEDIINNISAKTTKTEFDKKIGLSVSYTITRNGEEIASEDIIATGDILTTKVGDKYTLIVSGDINKDGEVTLKDFIKMRIYLLEENNLDEIEKIAADCNLDGKTIGVKDFIRMRLIILMQDV